MWYAAFADADILESDNSQGVIVNESLCNGFESFISELIVVQVNLTKFIFVLEDLADFLSAFRCYLIVF